MIKLRDKTNEKNITEHDTRRRVSVHCRCQMVFLKKEYKEER